LSKHSSTELERAEDAAAVGTVGGRGRSMGSRKERPERPVPVRKVQVQEEESRGRVEGRVQRAVPAAAGGSTPCRRQFVEASALLGECRTGSRPCPAVEMSEGKEGKSTQRTMLKCVWRGWISQKELEGGGTPSACVSICFRAAHARSGARTQVERVGKGYPEVRGCTRSGGTTMEREEGGAALMGP
jgi:hypothetical protein